MNSKELALQQFVKLKSLYEYPRLYLISYFSELRNEVNVDSNELNLALNGTKLIKDNSATFLGIRFDNHLTFRNQMDYLKKKHVWID
jgi:hypothetical protein